MKCVNCNKTIPSSLVVCPHCKKDPYIKDEVDFGTINSSNYGNGMDIKVNMVEKKKKKKSKLIIVLIVLFILILAGGFIFIGSKGSSGQNLIFNKFINNVFDKIEPKIEEVYSGKYSFDIKVNTESYNFNGNYEYDISNRYLNIDGEMEDPNKKNGGIILQDKDLNFKLIVNELNMYFDSKNINEKPILLPLDNYSLYLNKKIDYTSILDGLKDALTKAFKSVTYTSGKVKYNYKNENVSVNKTTLTIDSNSNYLLTKNFLEKIIDDSSLMSELSKITTYDEETLTEYLNNYIQNAKIGKDIEMTPIYIDVYHKGNNIYEVNYNKEYSLKIVDNNYEFTKYNDGKEVFNLTISKQSEMHQDYEQIIYDFDIKYGKNSIIGTLKLKDNLEANVKKQEMENYINLNSLNEQNLKDINNRINYYFKNVKVSNILYDKLKMRCLKGLSCNCEDKNTCTCLYQNKMITCDYKLVN